MTGVVYVFLLVLRITTTVVCVFLSVEKCWGNVGGVFLMEAFVIVRVGYVFPFVAVLTNGVARISVLVVE